jgi:hypothetical protein
MMEASIKTSWKGFCMAQYDSGATFDSGIVYDEPVAAPFLKPKPTHMRDLHIYLTNPFDDPHISFADLVAFTSDHLQRAAASPVAALAARTAPTFAALTAVQAAFADDETKLGQRKASKQNKNLFRNTLAAAVGKIAIAVQAQFGEGSATFAECFPHGRTIFGSCSDDTLAAELQTLLNGVTKYSPPLAASVVTETTALKTSWNAVYAPSEASTGAKTGTVAAKNSARAALQLELFKNLLALAAAFPRQPEQLDLYMQASLLSPHTPGSQPPPPPPAAPGG